jgi:hypothetical protein
MTSRESPSWSPISDIYLPKVALIVVELFRVIVHAPLPEQPPSPQPAKDPFVAEAVSVTTDPIEKGTKHLPVHLIPAGVLVTTPFPGPPTLTDRVTDCMLNVAVRVVAAATVTAQLPVPAHPPPFHPTNVDPVAGMAVRVTTAPLV